MDAVWVDGNGAGGLADGYAEEGDSVSYTFTVRHIPRTNEAHEFCFRFPAARRETQLDSCNVMGH